MVTKQRLISLLLCTALLMIAGYQNSAYALPNGFTGRTLLTSSAGCGSCHGSSANTGVQTLITGPSVVLPNQSVTFTIRVTFGGGTSSSAGVDIAVSAGTLSPVSSRLQLSGTEITQNAPLARGTDYSFTYTAPASAGPVTMYATVAGDANAWNWATNFPITVSSPVPPVPALSTPSNGATNQPTTLTLGWNASSGATSYRLQVSIDSLFGTTVVDDSTLTGTSTPVSGLTGATLYYWHVRAKNVTGTSAWSLKWNFTTSNQAAINVSLASGWNLISNPVTNPVPGDSVRQLYPTSLNPYAFEFSGGYVQKYRLANGKGYWEKFPGAISNPITGTSRTRDSVSVAAGWNIVGTISNSVDTSTIVSVPPGLRGSNWFGYSSGYNPVAQLVPGFGYWVKANAAGRFVLATGPILAKSVLRAENPLNALNSLTMTDSKGGSQTLYFGADENKSIQGGPYDMPPLPPVGAFDARFTTADGGSMVQTHAANVSSGVEFPIAVQSDAYPLTISWSVKDASYELMAGAGSMQVLRGEGTMRISNGEVNRLILKLTGNGQLPKEFELSQNYPNPFNPSTTIKYDLPKDSRVNLELFNILGQEVATLVNEDQKAGYKTVQWIANNFASGVYFYRIQAGDFVASKKLLLLK